MRSVPRRLSSSWTGLELGIYKGGAEPKYSILGTDKGISVLEEIISDGILDSKLSFCEKESDIRSSKKKMSRYKPI